MSIVTCDIAVTIDGYSAGPSQSLERPFGELDAETLHAWHFPGLLANHQAEQDALLGADAYIMGRKMFSPAAGPWPEDWRGWWGDEPPYHAPVFVLTHHPHPPIELTGTTFHFVTGGPAQALSQAREVAQGGRVAIAGGAFTVNEYLALGEIDELRLHLVPHVAGFSGGTRLFDGVGQIPWKSVRARWTPEVTHLVYRR